MKNRSCSICNGPIDDHVDENGVVYWTGGHNAQPINNGRCCTSCNNTVVIHARITGIDKSHIKTDEVREEPELRNPIGELI